MLQNFAGTLSRGRERAGEREYLNKKEHLSMLLSSSPV